LQYCGGGIGHGGAGERGTSDLCRRRSGSAGGGGVFAHLFQQQNKYRIFYYKFNRSFSRLITHLFFKLLKQNFSILCGTG